MRSWILFFLLGILCLQCFSHLPNTHFVWVIVAAVIFLKLFFVKYWQWLRLPVASVLGFAWSLWYAGHIMTWHLPAEWEGKPLVVTGYIASIPNINAQGVSFLFSTRKIQSVSVHTLLRLSWRENWINLHVGDKWQFVVRVKKPYGTMNVGGFDYEAWALQEGIRANGYIVNHWQNKLINSHWYRYPLDRIRQFFKEKIAATVPQSNTSPWITALAIGERQGISSDNWQVLRNTGTNHLMAIAGLHIGFMAALAHFVVANVWRRIPPLALKVPAVQVGAIAALLMALIYSAMAGFSIPTQRASIMLTVFIVTLLLRRKIAPWQAWNCALLIVLLINPMSVLTDSFWLSFGSVALIIYGVSGRLSPKGLWWKWGRIQWVIAVGLIPLSIGLFQQCSFTSFIANSIAIPWVGFVVVPLCLLGCFLLLFSAKAGGFILWLDDKILSVLWSILTWFAHLPWVSWYQVISHQWIIMLAVMGMVFLLLPMGFPGRYFGIIWMLPLVLFKPQQPEKGSVWLTLLDVGQGLSAVIQTQKHVLVFDAGPRLNDNYDMGESVVVPFLHSIHAKQIDMLVVSHGDNDHSGGVGAVMRQFPVLSVKASELMIKNSSYCLRGSSWQWDDVNFAFIYPPQDKLDLDNNSSCVLRITSGNQHILLTGDIEKLAEKELIQQTIYPLQADILVAPHHGSKTSALYNFVERVNPTYVLFPVGYGNRYHFPNVSVVETYRHFNVIQYDTATSGAIRFILSPGHPLALPNLYRIERRRYWNN